MSKRIRDTGKELTAERLISGLDFGFWTNFLTKEYEEPRNNSLLWPHLTSVLFPGASTGTRRHVIEKKFNRIRELRNRLSHHEAIWKFQEQDASGRPDYRRPVYGLNASLHLLRRAWNDILDALFWLSPERHSAFLAEGHHARFEVLATHDGLYCFTGRNQLSHQLNLDQSGKLRELLSALRQHKIVKLTEQNHILAIIGADFIRWKFLPRSTGEYVHRSQRCTTTYHQLLAGNCAGQR
ncbi:hypothetical protein [Erwinia sp. V71]|uniref:hypothetical protein n=1 Tax=Erwinia sp. V71 TaxID=3369424 RepID=UPI003F600E97